MNAVKEAEAEATTGWRRAMMDLAGASASVLTDSPPTVMADASVAGAGAKGIACKDAQWCVMADAPIVVGARVRLRAAVRTPHHGWGSVTKLTAHAGRVDALHVSPGAHERECDAMVSFPALGIRGWRARAAELVVVVAAEGEFFLKKNLTVTFSCVSC